MVAPLLCLTLTLPVVYALTVGVGVRRAEEATPVRRGRLLRLLAHLALSAAVVAVFIIVTGDLAIQRGRSTGAHPLIGAPANVDAQRLVWFGIGMVALVVAANLLLAGQLQPGSGFRERIDRLRSPQRRRGEAGSSTEINSASTPCAAAVLMKSICCLASASMGPT
jgi:hypothetical protein